MKIFYNIIHIIVALGGLQLMLISAESADVSPIYLTAFYILAVFVIITNMASIILNKTI